MINWLYRNAVFPLSQPAKYGGLRREMEKYATLEGNSLAENQMRQWDSLLRLLQHAYDSTPFYHNRFEQAGIQPCDIKSPEDLNKIPPLTREDLRERHDDLWSRRYRRESLSAAATGGTTDTPVPLLRAPESLLQKSAVHFRFNVWAGLSPGDKVFYLWGALIDFAQDPSWRWRFYDRYIMRRVWAPTSLLNDEVLESYRQLMNKFRPRIVYAYPTPLALFCEYLRKSGKTFHRPHSVICSAELLLESQRLLIGEVLGCPIFEMYGSREFGMIAAECEQHCGLHLNPYAAFIEFIPVEGAEREGLHELYVTDLLNDGMPVIRYKINDCSVLSPAVCNCGRGYPLIQPIAGRVTDNFYLPNQDIIPGVSLTNRVIKVCPGLKKTQFIQESMTDFRVRFVPGHDFTPEDLQTLQRTLKEFFGPSVHWTFEKVADIERERSGKTRFCISHVARQPAVATVQSEGRSR